MVNSTKKVKKCVDCLAEGITTNRKAPHPGPRCATHNRARKSKVRTKTHAQRIHDLYGLSTSDYWKIYAYQGSVCAICRRATGKRKRLSVDHDHKTGQVRGLCCSTCNSRVLGHLRDDPNAFQRAIDYLTKPPAEYVLGKRFVPEGGAPVNK